MERNTRWMRKLDGLYYLYVFGFERVKNVRCTVRCYVCLRLDRNIGRQRKKKKESTFKKRKNISNPPKKER